MSISLRQTAAERELDHVACVMALNKPPAGFSIRVKFGGTPHERTLKALRNHGFTVEVEQHGWSSSWFVTI